MKHKTRETWLAEAVKLLAPRYKDHGKLPKVIHAITSWPKSKGKYTIAECFSPEWTPDKSTYVTVSPILKDPVDVLAAVVHELVHALGVSGHGNDFKKIGTALGLTGKMMCSKPSDPLIKELKAVAKKLGPYPHTQMKNGKEEEDKPKKKQPGPMTLVSPADEKFTIYMSRKKFKEYGAPICPECNKPFVPRDNEDGEDDGE